MEQRGVIRSAGLVGALTAVSRLLGLARDMAMAAAFGTSMAMSAFVVAFRIPNLFRALFGEGALSAAFIPVFVETRQAEGDAGARRLAQRVFTLLTLALLLLTGLGVAGVSVALAWGPWPERVELTLRLTRIMLPYLAFICLAAAQMGVLNAAHRFAVPAAVPWVLNLVLLASILGVAPRLGDVPEVRILAVAWAVPLAGLLQAGVQWPSLGALGFRPWPRGGFGHPRMRQMLSLMGPAALGRAVTQINVLVDSVLAMWIGAWAPAALFFSNQLINLPIGVFATALGTVLLPVLSGHTARQDEAAFLATVRQSLRMLLFVMVPAAFGLAALGGPIVALFFEWRTFTAESTELTARALRVYAAGLLFYPFPKVLVPAFHAAKDMRSPVRVGLVAVGLNIALSILFMRTFPAGYEHAGIALATVVAAAVSGVGLGVLLHRRFGSPGWTAVGKSALRMLGAGVALAAAARVALALAQRLPGAWSTGKPGALLALLLAIAAGTGAYLLVLWLTHAPEIGELRAALRRRDRRPS